MGTVRFALKDRLLEITISVNAQLAKSLLMVNVNQFVLPINLLMIMDTVMSALLWR